MAKLRAYGRTELVRMVRDIPDTATSVLTNLKLYKTLMSDGNVLAKSTYTSIDWNGKPKHEGGRWTRREKTGMSREEFITYMESRGYKCITS